MQDLTTDQIREHWRADAAAIAADPGEADKRYIMSRASDLYFQENRAALKEPTGNSCLTFRVLCRDLALFHRNL